MAQEHHANWLDRPVTDDDHVLGVPEAEITLVEYGSYACPHCRAANDRIIQARDTLGDRLRYVFRHRPIPGSDIARRAAELAEQARTEDQFWQAHVALMTRSPELTEDDLAAVARDLGLDQDDPEEAARIQEMARERVAADIASAGASGVMMTPTFFINSRRYDGPWDESAFTDAMLGRLGHRMRAAALDFAGWAPSAGILLLLAALAAVILTNSALGPAFIALWEQTLAISLGDAVFRLTLLEWINDGLLTIFFLVVGLEIKREFTTGHLSGARAAALPVAAAIGGMMAPAGLYTLLLPAGPLAHGWGVPIATDTAFAVALIAMMGARVPVALRIFLTAAAIVDDIGAIAVVAALLFRRIAVPMAGGGRTGHAGAGPAQPGAHLQRGALCAAGHAAVGLRPCGRAARHPGGRGAGGVHSHPAAAQPEDADDPGGQHHPGRSPAPRRSPAGRAVHTGPAGAGCHP